MSCTEFAKYELTRAGLFDKDSDYGGMLGDAVLRMIEQFAAEGHSGFSAGMAISLFEKLARFQPLSPLTGSDDEWTEVSTDLWQNKRCSNVFKDADGVAYDIDGKIFEDADGCRFTNRDSRTPITFPYVPKAEIVKV